MNIDPAKGGTVSNKIFTEFSGVQMTYPSGTVHVLYYP